MQTITLPIEPRETGKAAARSVRGAGLVPCVLYGSHTEPVHFSATMLDLRPLIYTSETYLVSVTADGNEYECIIKDVDFHPVTDKPIHIDFQALTRGEAITMAIPIHLEGQPQGVKDGGNLSQPLNEIVIRCLPKDIPGHVSIDVTPLVIGDSLHVRDLDLPETIELLTDAVRTIVTVSAPRREEEPEALAVEPMFDEEGNLIEAVPVDVVEGEEPEEGAAEEEPAAE